MTGQVLLIEDDDALRTSLAQTIELAGMTPLATSSYVQARRTIRASFGGVILSDIRMPNQDGFDVLRAARTADTDLPVILMTGHSDVPTAMRAMKDGAWDYLEKPCNPDRLVEVLTRALGHRRLVLKSRGIERALLRSDPAAVTFPGAGKVSEGLRQALRAVAQSRAHLHLWGDEGTGTRQAAYVVNQMAAEPCALLRIDLRDAEALDRLRLPDEPADLVCRNATAAAHGTVERLLALAGDTPNLRLVTLAEQPIDSLGWRGQVTETAMLDGMIEIRLPTLDERREDLPEIFEVLLRQAVRTLDTDMPDIPDTLAADLMTRSWPGNLPQLRHFATSFLLGSHVQRGAVAGQTLAEQVEAFEKLVITEALRRTNGNAADAAKSLGLPRNTFYDRLMRYELSAKDFRRA